MSIPNETNGSAGIDENHPGNAKRGIPSSISNKEFRALKSKSSQISPFDQTSLPSCRVPVTPRNGPSSPTTLSFVSNFTCETFPLASVAVIVFGGADVLVQTAPSCQVTVVAVNVAISPGYAFAVACVALEKTPRERRPRLSAKARLEVPFV